MVLMGRRRTTEGGGAFSVGDVSVDAEKIGLEKTGRRLVVMREKNERGERLELKTL